MNVLLVYPGIPDNTYWSFRYALSFQGKRAAQPPLGLMTVAAMLPSTWPKRLVDMNVESLRDSHLAWADVVLVSAMLVQRESLAAVITRCREHGLRTVVGGPITSSLPPSVLGADHVVIGEAEDIMPSLVRDLETGSAHPVYRAPERPSLDHTPPPDLSLIRMHRYSTMTLQYSRGCPYQCEFCDIIEIYGRKPRTKPIPRVLSELDQLHAAGWRGAIFLVDDNFIGNRQRAKALLLELTAWQMRHHHPFRFTTEASLNLADDSELLQLFEAAGFTSVFLGIETPNESALITARKLQNTGRDLLASIRAIQLHGIEVMGGFILGFDTDCEDIFDRLADFIQSSAIPIAMVGLLQAVPGTRLYRRLVEEGRILTTSTGNNTAAQLNFLPRMNPSSLIEGYRGVLRQIYSCDAYYERVTRFLSQCQSATRLQRRARLSLTSLRALFSSLFRQGILDRHRLAYWRFVLTAATRYRRSFGTAMTLAVMGYHFQRITDQLCNQRS